MIVTFRPFVTACLISICWPPAMPVARVVQDRAHQSAPLEEGAAGDLSPREIQRLFDAYVVMQAQERLALTDAQFPQFLTRLTTMQESRRRSQQRRNQLLQELARLSNPGGRVDEPALRERLKALQEHESQAAAELRKAYDALDQVLDIRQQARFRVFEEQMERRKLELLMRARLGGRPRPLKRQGAPPR